jgi:hypothetical protein
MEKVVIHVQSVQIMKVIECRRWYGSVQHILLDRVHCQSGNVHKELGIDPLKLLYDIVSADNLGSMPNDEGIPPDSIFLSSWRTLRLVTFPNPDGIAPDNLL